MAPTPTKYAELEIGLHARTDTGYQVELRFSHPDSDAEVTPERGTAPLDLEELLSLQSDDRAYGETLAARLFHDENVKTLYAQARTAVETSGVHLRLRVAVGPGAAALHAVRWELLRDPGSGARGGAFATSERTPFSRFMVTRDWRNVRSRPRAELRALIAVAAPSGLDRYGLAEVPRDGEIERARRALQGMGVRVAAAPLTLERLVAQLRDGVDVLYLVCHGALRKRDGEPFLFLQGEDAEVVRAAGADLAERVAELERPPRLVVLASCESAGTEGGTDISGEPTAQSSLAPRLAAAGVPAILAMQGRISMTTVEKLMPIFFEKLLEDGQIDRALAIARGSVRHRPDSWIPALYLRLKGGRLWNDAGFGDDDEVRWENLCRHVRVGQFIPIVGSGIAEKVCLNTSETARRLAHRHGFPLEYHQRADLPRVLQYLSSKEKVTGVVPELKGQLHRQMLEMHDGILPDELREASLPKLMDTVGKLRRLDPDEPHRVLAELKAKIYVTANYDNLLYLALQAAGREPQRLVTSWREKPPRTTPLEDPPSAEKPALYHLLGFLKNNKSLVLTEDDYIDYLIAASNELIPNEVASPLADSSLLFLGFSLTDWSFRVLFRLILSLEGRGRLRDYPHVAVQVDPARTELADAAGARKYLRRYFGKAAEIDVYWGSPEDFLEQLREKLATLPQETAYALGDDDDDWD